jgi:hypothetical protein
MFLGLYMLVVEIWRMGRKYLDRLTVDFDLWE